MPSRTNRFISALLSGYGNLCANVVFTVTSVPLALHYLDKERFGLWALALQVNGYLNLIDLGMSGAVSRFIADYKDDVNGGDYGSHLLVGGLVFIIQGLLIMLAGAVFSWFAPSVFAVPGYLASEFRMLLFVLTLITGFSVMLRSISSPLWAFQRNDVIYGCAGLGLLVSLGLLWVGFCAGWGVMSFAMSQIPVSLGTLGIYAWIGIRNGYFPNLGHWGKFNMEIFWRIFHFGKDNLMVTMGSQLINASQIMIISRWINLEAAATFSVATKFYTMAMQLVSIPIAASASGLTELYVRGDLERFVRRYWDLISMTLAASCLVATSVAAGNRSLIEVWTRGAISWSWFEDLLLALLIILRNINGCFVGIFGLTKNWKPVRHIYLLEGIVFIPSAVILAKFLGLSGVLIASLLTHLLVTTSVSARAAGRIIGTCSGIVTGVITSLVLVAIAAAFSWSAQKSAINNFMVLGATAVIAVLSLVPTWRFILLNSIRHEIGSRMGAVIRRIRIAVMGA